MLWLLLINNIFPPVDISSPLGPAKNPYLQLSALCTLTYKTSMTTGPVSLLLVGLGLLNPYTKALLNSSTFTSPSNSNHLFYISVLPIYQYTIYSQKKNQSNKYKIFKILNYFFLVRVVTLNFNQVYSQTLYFSNYVIFLMLL